jgi:hypothetical protein
MPVSTRGPKGEADGQGSQTVPSVNVPLAKELPAKLKVVSERPEWQPHIELRARVERQDDGGPNLVARST